MNDRFPLARLLACLLLCSGSTLALAQSATPAVADPQAAVPATRYQSGMARPAEPPAGTPDQHRVAGNAAPAGPKPMQDMPRHDHAAMSGVGAQAASPVPAAAPAMCADGRMGAMQGMQAEKAGAMQCMSGKDGKGCSCCGQKAAQTTAQTAAPSAAEARPMACSMPCSMSCSMSCSMPCCQSGMCKMKMGAESAPAASPAPAHHHEGAT